MNNQLSRQQIESYRENGFIVIPDFLTADELEPWRAAVEEAVSTRGDLRIPDRPQLNADPDDYYTQVFVQRVNLWQTCPRIKPLILDARIGKMCCQLEGIDGVRVWHDQALIKQPWANQTGWHLDNPYWSFTSRHSISIWVALDDATLQNGCLYFLPGSHREGTAQNTQIGPNLGDLFRHYPQWATRDAVAAPMKAGSCSFHNGLLAHGAGANFTPRPRRAMTCAFMPDGATFNGTQNILTDDQVARLKVGQPMDDDEQNPIVHRRE
jgi:ectoine hydroxylase-related dioxygenase (phytanoyl-CoA dioxygenase family)